MVFDSDTEFVFQRLDKKDEQTFNQGDAIDMKASVVLVVITFLATQSGYFLTTAGSGKGLQVWSVAVIALAGVLAVLELRPRNYQTETSEALDGWLQELLEYYKSDSDPKGRALVAFNAGQIQRTKERIAVNGGINETKSILLSWSFRATMVALALNLVTLVLRA